MVAGFLKMPEPMMVPTTTAMVITGPRPRTMPASVDGVVVFMRSCTQVNSEKSCAGGDRAFPGYRHRGEMRIRFLLGGVKNSRWRARTALQYLFTGLTLR